MELKLNLAEILDAHRGERHAVILHSYPDPDAISCAYVHQTISAEYGIAVDILYTGEISHQQNLALVHLLGIDLEKFGPSTKFEQYQAAIFVDHQGTTVQEMISALEAAKIPVLLVVDHHEDQENITPEFSEIHKTGSTATIYAHYLQQGSMEMDGGHKEHITAATALLHGILTDTGEFARASAEDFQAAAYLSRFRDAELLEQIMNQARSKQAMDVIRRALENRVIVENYSISGIGYLRSEDRDTIPEATDFLLTEENVHTAIVYGILSEDGEREILTGSLRTTKLTLDPDDFIKEVFGKSSDGRFYGGGKPSAGGFAVPVGFLSGEQSEEFQGMKWQVYDAQIQYKLFEKIGVEREVLNQME